jgi:hypothetical protein
MLILYSKEPQIKEYLENMEKEAKSSLHRMLPIKLLAEADSTAWEI